MSGPRPDKIYYRIKEVADLAGVEPYVLRYWETEFPPLSPQKTKGGQRIYSRRDIEIILQIKRLLYEEGYTIAGARKILAQHGAEAPTASKRSPGKEELRRVIKDLANEIRSLLILLDKDQKYKRELLSG